MGINVWKGRWILGYLQFAGVWEEWERPVDQRVVLLGVWDTPHIGWCWTRIWDSRTRSSSMTHTSICTILLMVRMRWMHSYNWNDLTSNGCHQVLPCPAAPLLDFFFLNSILKKYYEKIVVKKINIKIGITYFIFVLN